MEHQDPLSRSTAAVAESHSTATTPKNPNLSIVGDLEENHGVSSSNAGPSNSPSYISPKNALPPTGRSRWNTISSDHLPQFDRAIQMPRRNSSPPGMSAPPMSGALSVPDAEASNESDEWLDEESLLEEDDTEKDHPVDERQPLLGVDGAAESEREEVAQVNNHLANNRPINDRPVNDRPVNNCPVPMVYAGIRHPTSRMVPRQEAPCSWKDFWRFLQVLTICLLLVFVMSLMIDLQRQCSGSNEKWRCCRR